MENQEKSSEPKQKTSRDFMVLFLAIGGLIFGLILLKYLMGALHIM